MIDRIGPQGPCHGDRRPGGIPAWAREAFRGPRRWIPPVPRRAPPQRHGRSCEAGRLQDAWSYRSSWHPAHPRAAMNQAACAAKGFCLSVDRPETSPGPTHGWRPSRQTHSYGGTRPRPPPGVGVGVCRVRSSVTSRFPAGTCCPRSISEKPLAKLPCLGYVGPVSVPRFKTLSSNCSQVPYRFAWTQRSNQGGNR
jgi:hypothetical protein